MSCRTGFTDPVSRSTLDRRQLTRAVQVWDEGVRRHSRHPLGGVVADESFPQQVAPQSMERGQVAIDRQWAASGRQAVLVFNQQGSVDAIDLHDAACLEKAREVRQMQRHHRVAPTHGARPVDEASQRLGELGLLDGFHRSISSST
jgi:hypothetical protein